LQISGTTDDQDQKYSTIYNGPIRQLTNANNAQDTHAFNANTTQH